MAQAADDVQNHRQYHTQKDRSGKREINRGVLAAMDNVAGKPAKRQVRPPHEHQHNAGNHDNCAQDNQQLSQISHSLF